MPIEPPFSDFPSPPRISFSHDLLQSGAAVPVEERSSSSSLDFDFCVFRGTFELESSSADELFSDGKILPIQIKRRLAPMVRSPPPDPAVLPRPQPPPTTNEKRNIPESDRPLKSFWRFKKRSSSSNSDGGGGGGGLCPLPLLSRSNSAGGKRSNNQKQNFLRSSSSNSCQNQPRSASESYNYSSSRPPLKRNNSHGFYSNGRTKFNPVLNVPPANLFGLASIFFAGKDRSKKKHY